MIICNTVCISNYVNIHKCRSYMHNSTVGYIKCLHQGSQQQHDLTLMLTSSAKHRLQVPALYTHTCIQY